MNLLVQITKRFVDLAAGALGTAVLLMVAPVLGLAIKLDSPGPVFYSQRRAGPLLPPAPGDSRPRFREISIWKFRTMRVDAERYRGAVLAAKADPRVTRLGRFLRRTRLDELPQFVNILVGNMSLVGPRPERVEFQQTLALVIHQYARRMRGMKPGLTGLAQVNRSGSFAPAGVGAGLSHSLRRLPPDALVLVHQHGIANPYHLPEAEGALADELRLMLKYDLSYAAALESFPEYVATELAIIVRSVFVVLRSLVRRV